MALILQAYVINEDENDLLGSVQLSFSFLGRELYHASKNAEHCSPDAYRATEILAAVNKLGVNDENKCRIVASGALKSYVMLLGGGCSNEEQFLSAQGLWTLATKCPDDVRNQENCVAEVQQLLLTMQTLHCMRVHYTL